MERDQQDKGNEAPEDAKEDLELTDEDADEVRGGVVRDDEFQFEKFKYEYP